jgi:hypothetical protein
MKREGMLIAEKSKINTAGDITEENFIVMETYIVEERSKD